MNLLARVWKASQRIGLVPTVLCSAAWLVAGGRGAQAVAALLAGYPMLAVLSLSLVAVVTGLGGLAAFWLIADHVEYRKRGYRVRWVSGNRWLYEERASARDLRFLPYVRVILSNGYPAPCEVRIPSDVDWEAEVPFWAQRRRTEISHRIGERHGAHQGGDVRVVDR